MRKISTGKPSTLKTYREIALDLSFEGSEAVKYFDKMIADQGENMEVIADETQMLHLISSLVEAEIQKKIKELEKS